MRKPGIQDEAKIQKPSVNYYLICKYTVYLVMYIEYTFMKSDTYKTIFWRAKKYQEKSGISRISEGTHPPNFLISFLYIP